MRDPIWQRSRWLDEAWARSRAADPDPWDEVRRRRGAPDEPHAEFERPGRYGPRPDIGRAGPWIEHPTTHHNGPNVVFEGVVPYGQGEQGASAGTVWPPPYTSRRRRLPLRRFGKGPKGYRRSDARIREEICDELTISPHLDASDVEVQVENGEVTLTGTVPDRRVKHEIEELCEDHLGVSEVHNRIKLAQPLSSDLERTVL